MTKDKVLEIFKIYANRIFAHTEYMYSPTQMSGYKANSKCNTQLTALNHVLWMCEQIGDIYDQDYAKAMRWLGWAQGVLWSYDLYSLEELKEHNRV